MMMVIISWSTSNLTRITYYKYTADQMCCVAVVIHGISLNVCRTNDHSHNCMIVKSISTLCGRPLYQDDIRQNPRRLKQTNFCQIPMEIYYVASYYYLSPAGRDTNWFIVCSYVYIVWAIDPALCRKLLSTRNRTNRWMNTAIFFHKTTTELA